MILSRTNLSLSVALLLLAAAFSARISAQTASYTYDFDPSSDVVKLAKLEVEGGNQEDFLAPSTSAATKIETQLIDVPQTVDVVTRDLFSREGARSLEDALSNVAGVSPSVGDGQRDEVYIRGFSAQYDQYLDGVRDEAMYFRDLSNIESVDVLMGPSAVLYGHGSAGGLVDRITRQPASSPEAVLSTTFGSWGDWRTELDSGGPLGFGNLFYRLDLADEDSGGFRDQYFLQRHHISPSVAWQPVADTRVLVQFDYLDDSRLDDLGIPALVGPPGSEFPGTAPNVPISSYYGEPDSRANDFVRSSVDTGTLTVDHTLSPSLALHDVLRFEHSTLDRNNVLPTGVFLPDGGVYTGDLDAVWVNRSQRNILRYENDLFNQLETTWKAEAAGMENTVLTGLELGRQGAGLHSTQYNAAAVALVDPVLTEVPAGAAPVSVSATGVRADTAGLYLQDQITLTPQWKALAGVRLDYYEVTQQSRLAPYTVLESASRTLSPRLGIVYEPASTLSLYATVSQSFSPAAGDGLSTAATTAALAPLKATNYEVGAKKKLLGEWLSATASVFQLTRNITETDPLTELTTAAGEQRSRGVDLSLTGRLAEHWNISASYELLDPTLVNGGVDGAGVALNGKTPTLVPRNSVSLFTTYDLGGGFGLGCGATAMGARFTSDDDSVSLSPFAVANAVVYYRHGHWDARINCNNLFNRRYYITAGEGTDYTGQTVMPGAPINVSGTVAWRF